MATPHPAPQPSPGNPYAAQGGYAPNPSGHPAPAPHPAYGGYGQPGGPAPAGAPQQAPAPYPQAQPQGAPYAQGYGAAGQAPAPGPGFPAAPAPGCRICGAAPAADITVRQHTGLLVAMRFSKMEGPFCRTCGTAIHRDMTAKTLAGGWWSPVSLILFAPLTLLWNLFVHLRLAKLPHPSPSPTGVVMDPGLPLARRPLSYVPLALPAIWLITIVAVLGGR
ncbi:hypothetical protein [Streptomyces sp. NPDC046197]|uniref:hypothetical protein n=1 Tax=Streptomyces sp. NPDC046197 TaxID=3154337 RepID=UPI003407B748